MVDDREAFTALGGAAPAGAAAHRGAADRRPPAGRGPGPGGPHQGGAALAAARGTATQTRTPDRSWSATTSRGGASTARAGRRRRRPPPYAVGRGGRQRPSADAGGRARPADAQAAGGGGAPLPRRPLRARHRRGARRQRRHRQEPDQPARSAASVRRRPSSPSSSRRTPMTDQRLRELVHDLADDLTPHDRVQPLRADHAVAGGRRRRRRSRVAVVGGDRGWQPSRSRRRHVAAGRTTTRRRPARPDRPPQPVAHGHQRRTAAARRPADADARVDGGAVCWSPDLARRRELPRVGGSGLPRDHRPRPPRRAGRGGRTGRPCAARHTRCSDDDELERRAAAWPPAASCARLDVSRLDQVGRQPDGYRDDPGGAVDAVADGRSTSSSRRTGT